MEIGPRRKWQQQQQQMTMELTMMMLVLLLVAPVSMAMQQQPQQQQQLTALLAQLLRLHTATAAAAAATAAWCALDPAAHAASTKSHKAVLNLSLPSTEPQTLPGATRPEARQDRTHRSRALGLCRARELRQGLMC